MADAVAKTSTPDAAAGNPIDITTVTTGAGIVDRQVVALGDPAANNKAAISAAGRVSVDASGVAVPITDNAGSLTVDAPVGTPAFVRLSDGAAAQVGQKTMAASLPVALASDQTTLPAVAEIRAATLHVTGTAAVNTALTITLPAAGAGLFHYITSIQWHKLYSIMGVAAGGGVLITSTNLP